MGAVNSLDSDEGLRGLLARFHAQSEAQIPGMRERARANSGPLGPTIAMDDPKTKAYLADKLVALEPEKARFAYLVCRALKARRAVEAGTSYGVSTLYLAAAMRDNGGGTVIGTEYEPAKAAHARANFAEAGLSDFIELREGDLRQTLTRIDGPVDFMLVDIWIAMALPALRLVAPHLRSGAVVLCDNTGLYAAQYADYLGFVRDPANGFSTMTLPFDGGLEMSVKIG